MKSFSKLISKLTLLVFVSLSLFVISNVLSPEHSKAAIANPGYGSNNCVQGTTEFNLIVYVRIEDYLGNLKGYSDNFQFSVDPHFTGANTQAWNDRKKTAVRNWNSGKLENLGAGVQTFQAAMNGNNSMPRQYGNICADTPGAPGTRMPAYAFRDGDWTCHVPLSDATSSRYPLNNPTAVPTQSACNPGQGDNSYGANGNNASRSLSCLELPGMAFTITLNVGSVSPDYVVNADSWSTRQAYKTNGSWLVTQFEYGKDTPGLLLNDTSQIAQFVYREPAPIPPNMTPIGDVSNTDPATVGYIEPGQSFNALGKVDATASTNGGNATASWRLWYDSDNDFSNGGVQLALVVNKPLAFGPPGGSLNIGSLLNRAVTNADANAYAWVCSEVYNVSVSGSPTPNIVTGQEKKCLPIQRHPYFQVNNGDINAAASLTGASGCPANTLSTISAFNKGNAPTYTGAKSGVAAFAAGAITEFASGRPPKGLTFANTAGAGNATYGGGFINTFCIPDYWSGVTATTPTTIGPATGSTSVNGDLYITGNSPNTSLTAITIGTIPLRWIVSTGNIYIDQNVTYLEGNYIAKGKIYTCATSLGAPVGSGNLNNLINCSQVLTVNGSLVAGAGIKLQRTAGSTNSSPAEIFIFSPDIWMQAVIPNSNVPTGSRGTIGKYDAITLLPPVL